ncbi:MULTISPECIES: MarR family winged helix-turn-helix transcriptional regulator [Saccharothrix]|uniref:MarR family winged helix-turn-helix transcriptional regulator n=1 Tax=Saccharothrix TaxID=2071 RepID=UPI00093F059D|nr:MarR family winged helix-turn-helix transcriptional regulator [Saccharothrix sp. CB00851]OKI18661.1 hypothetical protein A6A25_39625 [Saccharothrix sp. CB00851]
MGAKDLVRRVAGANDRRVVRIRLTDRGRRPVDGMPAEHMDLYARLLEPLDDTKTVVADALRRLLEQCGKCRDTVRPWSGMAASRRQGRAAGPTLPHDCLRDRA